MVIDILLVEEINPNYHKMDTQENLSIDITYMTMILAVFECSFNNSFNLICRYVWNETQQSFLVLWKTGIFTGI